MDRYDIALEILKAVNAHGRLDTPTLLGLASVNKFWYSLAVPKLYATVYISTEEEYQTPGE